MAQLSPIFNLPFFTDTNGEPLAGGKIFTYEAGSNSVLKETYTTQAGTASNPNPIVLDAAGRLPGGTNIWLQNNELYNLVLTAPDGTTVLKAFDNVSGVIVATGGGGGATVSVWVAPVPEATYLSGTSFLVVGNYTAEFAPGNRVRFTLSTGYTYGLVTASSFASGNTTVTIINDGVALNPSLSVAEYSILIASPGETVDAGGVSYFDSQPYTTANTVGWQFKQTATLLFTTNAKVASLPRVWLTSGSPAYILTTTPAITDYTLDATFVVKFVQANASVAATLNIDGVGAKPLKQYSPTGNGTFTEPNITAGMLSAVAYDAASDSFIVLDPAPAAAAAAPPKGMQVFTSNGTFTCPAGITTVKVTCVGGGGGGGGGTEVTNEGGTTYYAGGNGGAAATAVKYVTVTPGSTYTVAIGLAGAGGTTGPFSPTSGGAGGQSSFGISLVTAAGGAGGAAATISGAGNGGAGGSSGTGDVVLAGTSGNPIPGLTAQTGRTYGGGGTGGYGITNGTPGTSGVVFVEY